MAKTSDGGRGSAVCIFTWDLALRQDNSGFHKTVAIQWWETRPQLCYVKWRLDVVIICRSLSRKGNTFGRWMRSHAGYNWAPTHRFPGFFGIKTRLRGFHFQ